MPKLNMSAERFRFCRMLAMEDRRETNCDIDEAMHQYMRQLRNGDVKPLIERASSCGIDIPHGLEKYK